MSTEEKNTKSTAAGNSGASGTKSGGNGRVNGSATAKAAAGTAKKSAASGAQAAGETGQRVTRKVSDGLQSGQQALTANAAKLASAAGTAWTVVKDRKMIAAGAAAGVVGVASAAFAVGRTTAKPAMGPLTRLARGRI
ncbi:hypothetical protein ACIGO8_30945 [Streptomyces sp. NPDC053493]|uniref:hypothetical protein n=1 Tax=Streptomyces sp. NPDC053493 TaxID=3365705 RepID=UPI0037CDBC0C